MALTPDTLDPAEMHLSPVEVAELLAQLPADHPLVAAARVGVELADERHAAAVEHAETNAAVRDAVREQGGTPAVSGRDRAAERQEATSAWQRLADHQGPGSSYASRMVASLTRAAEQAGQREAADPEPDQGYTRSEATETCLQWAAEHREQREHADAARHRFAASPVDYGDDTSQGYVDDERDAEAEQASLDEAVSEEGARWDARIAEAGDDVDALRSMWWDAPPDARARITERGKELTADEPDIAYPPCDQDTDADGDLDDDDDGCGGSWWAADADDGDDAAVA